MKTPAGRHRPRTLIPLLLGAIVAWPSMGSAQSSDCTVPQEQNGLIRGDQVPRGCVLESATPTTYSPLWRLEGRERLRMHDRIYGAGIPIFFSLDPVGIVFPSRKPRLAPRPRAGPFDRRPRNIRGGNFGPLFHPFGPVIRPFGRLERPNR